MSTHPLSSSESNEWYTPSPILRAERKLFAQNRMESLPPEQWGAMPGAPDLDPASCEEANRLVCARAYYTAADDGLTKPWHGRVHLNPPYGKTGTRSNQEVWLERLHTAWVTGEIIEGVGVFAARPGAKWFMRTHSFLRCVLDRRIDFIEPAERQRVREAAGKASAGDTKGTIVVYAGWRWTAFAQCFGHLGEILEPRTGR